MTEAAPTIAFITRKWPPAVGGMETYSVRLVEALGKLAEIRPVVLPGRDDGAPPRPAALAWFIARIFFRLLFQPRPPEVLHLGDMVLWPLGLAGSIRSRKTRIVLSAHGTDVAFHRRGGVKGQIYALYLKLGSVLIASARVIANSNATRDVTAETGWRHIEVVPLATDLSGPAPTGEHDGSVLFVGRLVERKGCAWFIRHVLPLLPPHIRLKVAGTRWDDDESRAILDPRVDFLGSLRGPALIDAYRGALCVVVPNIEPRSGEFEGFGLVATEAASAGGLVLAARTGGIVQAVDDGVTGVLLAPGNGEAWARMIHEIAGWSQQQREKFLLRSMARCRSHFSWARVAQETFAAYALNAPRD